VLKELADLHNVDINDLRNQPIEYKGWSWSPDPYTMGQYHSFDIPYRLTDFLCIFTSANLGIR
jgi:hypothetical protein